VVLYVSTDVCDACAFETYNKLCGRPPQYAPAAPCKLTFDLLTLKVVSESRVTWATSVLILVFLGLSVLHPMYATDRRQSASSLNASTLWGRGHNKDNLFTYHHYYNYHHYNQSLPLLLQLSPLQPVTATTTTTTTTTSTTFGLV